MDGRIFWFAAGVASAWAFHRFIKPVQGKTA